MLGDPAFIQQMMQSNPMLQQMAQANPMVQQMLQNPQMLQQMMTPQNMQAAMSMMSQGGGMPGGMGGGMPNLSPEMMQQMQSMMGGMGGGANPTAAAADTRPPAEKYANELQQIKEMGFVDEEVVLQALVQCNGNVQMALERLFSGN